MVTTGRSRRLPHVRAARSDPHKPPCLPGSRLPFSRSLAPTSMPTTPQAIMKTGPLERQ